MISPSYEGFGQASRQDGGRDEGGRHCGVGGHCGGLVLLDVLATCPQLLLPVDLRQQLVHHVQLLQERERNNHDMSSRFLDFAIFQATFWMQTML